MPPRDRDAQGQGGRVRAAGPDLRRAAPRLHAAPDRGDPRQGVGSEGDPRRRLTTHWPGRQARMPGCRPRAQPEAPWRTR
nr:hypothetical protein [Cupriavidus gilardii]